MSDKTPVLLETTPEGIATITLNRPELHNAFNDLVIEQLDAMVDDLAKQDGVRVVLLQATGKSFSAGADLNWMRLAADLDEEANREDAAELGHLLLKLASMPQPTVALVQGAAIAGGLGLVAACDVAIAVRDAHFALTEVRLGLVPAVISPYVVAAIGARQARRYFLTAERFDAETALRLGLVHEVVADPVALMAVRDRLVNQFLSAAPGALAAAKDLIQDVGHKPFSSELAHETARRIAELRASPEGREGIASFLERRRPSWAKTD